MLNNKYLSSLSDANRENMKLVGGKAANLGEMIKSGLPVPAGYVIMTTGYKYFLKNNDLDSKITSLLNDLEENKLKINKVSMKLKNLFLEGNIPDNLKVKIKEIYDELYIEGGNTLAVRSSATVEDLPGSSFAGQYDTFLNIAEFDDLLNKIKECWASLWNERAISYRLDNNINNLAIAHAVVIQSLVNSQVSGVMFTANPLNGRRDQVLINSSWGQGEAIVSGKVTPDQWVISKEDRNLIEKEIADKEIMAVKAGSGIEFEKVAENKRQISSLSDENINELFKLSKKVEEYFNEPQDVEWAIEDNKTYLVQSRPVTTLYPLPEDDSEDFRLYLNFNLQSQGMQEPFTPLGGDIFKNIMCGSSPLINRKYQGVEDCWWYKMLGGRVFMDITGLMRNSGIRDNFIESSNDQDPLTAEALEQVYFDNQEKFAKNKKSIFKLILLVFKSFHPWVIKYGLSMVPKVLIGKISPDRGREKALDYGDDFIEKLKTKAKDLNTINEKLNFINQSSKEVFLTSWSLLSYIAVSAGYINKVKDLIGDYYDDFSELYKVERAVPYSPTTEMGMRLLKIAKKLDERGESPTINTPEIVVFLNKYGHRSLVEVDLGVANWQEEPGYIIDLIQSYIDNQSYQESIDNFYNGKKEAERAIDNITNNISEKAGKRKAKKVRNLLTAYRKMYGLREQSKFLLTRTLDLLRRQFKDIGQQLYKKGQLEAAEDIFYLYLADIEAKNTNDLKGKVEKNKRKYQQQQKMNAPRLITSTGESIYYPKETGDENILKGIPVSAGTIEGKAKIISDPGNIEKLNKGDILVTKATNPAWTPLFLSIGGLIMETGGPISHGSVVAREYGIPAVTGIKEATSKLKDGQLVKLNGERGTVKVLEE